MEFLIAAIAESIIESISDFCNDFMKKLNPNYDINGSKGFITMIFSVLLIIFVTAAMLGFLFILEWMLPNLLNVVSF